MPAKKKKPKPVVAWALGAAGLANHNGMPSMPLAVYRERRLAMQYEARLPGCRLYRVRIVPAPAKAKGKVAR